MRRMLTLAMLSCFASVLTAAPFPAPQITLQVLFEPSAFPSAGRTHLVYELHLTNFSSQPLTLSRLDVLDADDWQRMKSGRRFSGNERCRGNHAYGQPLLAVASGTVVNLFG
jgi:hypothetical protein